MFKIPDGDLLPKPVMARNVGVVWLSKLFPGHVEAVKPQENYVKIFDPQGCVMWATINKTERTFRISHKIFLNETLLDEHELHIIVGLANKKSRYNRFVLVKGKKGYFIYAVSFMPLREKLYPTKILKSFESHWIDFKRGFNSLHEYCLRAKIG